MEIFDAHIRSDERDSTDLKNLRYFETTHALTSAHPGQAFGRADELIHFWRTLVENEVERLARAGIHAYVALGVRPDGRPRRSHYEIWRELPVLLEDPAVVAIGEVAALEDDDDHWELFERQAKLALELDLALLITPPRNLRVNMTYKMMRRLNGLGFDPSRCLLNHLDARLIETVVAEGFVAGVSVGPYHMDPREAARCVHEATQALGSSKRIVLNSALRAGAADILGLPKTIFALQEAGMDTDAIHELAFQNAMTVLRIDA